MKLNRFNPASVNRQSGITLIEILGVLVIVGIVTVALLRTTDVGNSKAKKSAVQQDFKSVQLSVESTLMNSKGFPFAGSKRNANYIAFNKRLDNQFAITSPVNGTGSSHPTANPVQRLTKKDPWGNQYYLQAKYVSDTEYLLLVESSGSDEKNANNSDLFDDTNASGTENTYNQDNIQLVTHYKNGKATSCSRGFSNDIGTVSIGSDSTPNYKFTPETYASQGYVLKTVPDNLLEPLRQKYKYEFIVDNRRELSGTTYVHRTHYFSDSNVKLIDEWYGMGSGYFIYSYTPSGSGKVEGYTWYDWTDSNAGTPVSSPVAFELNQGITMYAGVNYTHEHDLYAERISGNVIKGCF